MGISMKMDYNTLLHMGKEQWSPFHLCRSLISQSQVHVWLSQSNLNLKTCDLIRGEKH